MSCTFWNIRKKKKKNKKTVVENENKKPLKNKKGDKQ